MGAATNSVGVAHRQLLADCLICIAVPSVYAMTAGSTSRVSGMQAVEQMTFPLGIALNGRVRAENAEALRRFPETREKSRSAGDDAKSSDERGSARAHASRAVAGPFGHTKQPSLRA
jgi:hypothetical protein